MLFQLWITMWSESRTALEVEQSSVDGGRKERGEAAESGTARSSQCVCAQASAQGSTKGPLYCQKHTASLSLSLSLLTQQVWSWSFLSCVFPPLLLPLLLSCPVLPSSPLPSFPFLSFPHPPPLSSASPLLSWLNYSWQFIVPNGQCAADTEGFISLGPCVCCCVFVRPVCAWVCGWLG